MPKNEAEEMSIEGAKAFAALGAGALAVLVPATAVGMALGAGLAAAPDAIGRALTWLRSREERRWREYFALLEDLLKGRKTADGHLVAQLFNDPGNEDVHMRALLKLVVEQRVDARYLQLECVGPIGGSAEEGVTPPSLSLEITPCTMVTGSMTEGTRFRCHPLPQRTPRVFQLVIANGFAERGTLAYGATQPASCMIEADMIRRLAATLAGA